MSGIPLSLYRQTPPFLYGQNFSTSRSLNLDTYWHLYIREREREKEWEGGKGKLTHWFWNRVTNRTPNKQRYLYESFSGVYIYVLDVFKSRYLYLKHPGERGERCLSQVRTKRETKTKREKREMDNGKDEWGDKDTVTGVTGIKILENRVEECWFT